MGQKTVIYSNGSQQYLLTLPVLVNQTNEVKALLDSGASANFVHSDTARSMKLPTYPRKEPLSVTDVQGRSLGTVEHIAKAWLDVAHHREEIDFSIIPIGIHGLILGLPWLQKHNPDINWKEKTVKFSSPFCRWSCIRRAHERP